MDGRDWSVVLVNGSGKALEILARNEWLSSAVAFAAGFGGSGSRIAVVMSNAAAEACFQKEEIEMILNPNELTERNFVGLQSEERPEANQRRLQSWLYFFFVGNEDVLNTTMERLARAVCREIFVDWEAFCDDELDVDELAARLMPRDMAKVWQEDVLQMSSASVGS